MAAFEGEGEGLQHLYADIAARYEGSVVPAFAPLAADFTGWLLRCAAANRAYELYDPFDDELLSQFVPAPFPFTALDLGAGTGLLARCLAPYMQRVVCVDLSLPMLRAGQSTPLVATGRARWLEAHNERLALKARSVQVAATNFGLNASVPMRALREAFRCLAPGGLLCLQEWGAEDSASQQVDETFAEFTPDTLPPYDPAVQAFFDAPAPWYDQLQDAQDYYLLLKKVGFRWAWCREVTLTIALPSLETFLAYRFAWYARQHALRHMTAEQRAALDAALRKQFNVDNHTGSGFVWRPSVFRVCAVK
jgi:ubiquinone/menaquinone biosynthesis C-methylase UbiE